MKIRSIIYLTLASILGSPLAVFSQSRTAKLKSPEYPFSSSITELTMVVPPECNIDSILVRTGTLVITLNDGAEIAINRAGGFVTAKGGTFVFGPPKIAFDFLPAAQKTTFMAIADQALGLVESAVTLYTEYSPKVLHAAYYAADRSDLAFDGTVIASVQDTLQNDFMIDYTAKPRGMHQVPIDIDGKVVVTPSTGP